MRRVPLAALGLFRWSPCERACVVADHAARFQVPDENAHYAYVSRSPNGARCPRTWPPRARSRRGRTQTLGRSASSGSSGTARTRRRARSVEQDAIATSKPSHLATAAAATRSGHRQPAALLRARGGPYKLASGAGVLDRLAAMRLLSALLGGRDGAVRLPVPARAAAAHALGVAGRGPWWSPSSRCSASCPAGVNNDDLLYLSRRGLAVGGRAGVPARPHAGARRAVGGVPRHRAGHQGDACSGFVPARRAGRGRCWRGAPGAARGARALRGRRGRVGAWRSRSASTCCSTTSSGTAARPRAAVGSVAGRTGRRASSASAKSSSHVWQLLLPRLSDAPPVHALLAVWDTWFKGFVGHVRLAGLRLPGMGLPTWRRRVRSASARWRSPSLVRAAARAAAARWPSSGVYAAAVVGLCVEIGVQSYRYLVADGAAFEQAALPAAAARRFTPRSWRWPRALGGRRWGPVLGAVLVVLAFGHDLFAQAVTSRATTRERRERRHRRDPGAQRRRAAGGVLRALGAPDGRARAARVRLGLERRLGRSWRATHGARVHRDRAGRVQPRRHAQPADARGRGRRTWRCSRRTPSPPRSAGSSALLEGFELGDGRRRSCTGPTGRAPTPRSRCASSSSAGSPARARRCSRGSSASTPPSATLPASALIGRAGLLHRRQRLHRARGLGARAVPRRALRRGPRARARHAARRLSRRRSCPRRRRAALARLQRRASELRRCFDEWRGLREVYGWREPLRPRTPARPAARRAWADAPRGAQRQGSRARRRRYAARRRARHHALRLCGRAARLARGSSASRGAARALARRVATASWRSSSTRREPSRERTTELQEQTARDRLPSRRSRPPRRSPRARSTASWQGPARAASGDGST